MGFLTGLAPPAPSSVSALQIAAALARRGGYTVPTLLSSAPQWIFVERRFRAFAAAMEVTPAQLDDYRTKVEELVSCLNRWYWPNIPAGHVTHVIGGSWSKGTQARPGSDIDLIFFLPMDVYHRYEQRIGNKQSALLQEVRDVLLRSYPRTDIKGDGPTVVVDFSTIKIEVVPSFVPTFVHVDNIELKAFVCDTNNGGRYKPAAPIAEKAQAAKINTASNGNFVALARMMRAWKRFCNVPVKSTAIDQMIASFLETYPYAHQTPFWHDWMVRDCFGYMLGQRNSWAILPVSGEIIAFGEDWVSRTETAYNAAYRACVFEQQNHNTEAGEEWQKIFGVLIPKEVS